jgi:hypothetical protein
MGRVINTDSNGKRRNQIMRTAAEILRRLSLKTEIDEEVRDMTALLVFLFREMDEGIEESAAAWEKRDYWLKADEFRQRWNWAGRSAEELQSLIFDARWDLLPQMMIKLLPYFSEIKINKFTRKDSEWEGSYDKLMRERPA